MQNYLRLLVAKTKRNIFMTTGIRSEKNDNQGNQANSYGALRQFCRHRRQPGVLLTEQAAARFGLCG